MNDILFGILQVFIISAVAAILRYCIPFLTGLLRSHNYNFAADIIETAVRAAEQTISGHGRGDEKFEIVVNYVRKQLDSYGIRITEEQVAQLIEAAVQTMNAETRKEVATNE